MCTTSVPQSHDYSSHLLYKLRWTHLPSDLVRVQVPNKHATLASLRALQAHIRALGLAVGILYGTTSCPVGYTMFAAGAIGTSAAVCNLCAARISFINICICMFCQYGLLRLCIPDAMAAWRILLRWFIRFVWRMRASVADLDCSIHPSFGGTSGPVSVRGCLTQRR